MTSRPLDPAEVAATFDQWVQDGKDRGMESHHRDVVLQLLDRARLQREHHLLDLGCGNGWTVRLAAAFLRQGKVFGCDLSEQMIEKARGQANPANVAFSQGSAEALPYADASLDRVISMETVYYWPDPLAAFKEIHRVLKPGGRFLAALEFFQENPYTAHWAEALQLPLPYRSDAEYCALLQDSGFPEVRSGRLQDRRPLPEEDAFQPSRSFPDFDAYRQYRQIGALLLEAKRPDPN
ncbi:MAG: SAM-dependent methyltransferase [Planctomycetota bacterium]|nr:MAG: SAM-dependent methyltransferase [Planctomycetota bacterium]